MLDALTLPAVAPPTGDLRPPPTASGPATERAGGQPFDKVLAAAAEAETADEPVDTAPVETDPALLAALAALLNPQPETPPVVAAPAPSTEAPGPAPTEAAPAQTTAAVLDLVPLTTAVAPEAPTEAAETGFAAHLAQVMTSADTAAVSTEAAAQVAPTVTASASAAASPSAKAPVPAAAPKPAEEPGIAAETLLAANPAAPAPLTEPARLAEAQPTVGPAPAPEAVVLPQVVRGLESLVRSGGSAMHVQLHPEALGRIDLHLTATADGMRVTLTADMAATGNLLQQNLSDLRQSLAESGLNIANLSVSVGQGQADNGYLWQRHLPHNTGGASALRADTRPSDAPPRAAVLGMGARVDYRI